MKKLLLIALASTFSFISCEDDESTETPSNEIPSELIGKWRLDYYTPEDFGDGLESIEDCEKESIYQYTEDGKYIYEYVLTIEGENPYCAVDGEGEVSFSVVGNKITTTEDNETTTTTFFISEDKLTITYENGNEDIYIKTTDPFFSELQQ